jgi:adenosine deaminase
VCPTSNALTLHLPSLYHHPTLSPWLHAGYPITICTDDSGVFDVTLSEEIAGVAHTHKLTPARTRELALAGFQHSFVEPEVKRWLMRRAKEIAEEAEEGGPGVAS